MIHLNEWNIVTRLMLKRTLILTAFLAGLWLVLSGYLKGLLLLFGLASIALVALIASRMDVVDDEGHPYHLQPFRVLHYWGWLLIEIIKSNLDVSKRILLPSMPITPVLLWVHATQPSELGQVIYANSITLTPGTVSVDLKDDYIEVHALTRETADALRTGEMDRQVTALERHN